MELIIAAIAQQIIPVVGTVIAALAAWGVSLLKEKTKADVAKSALDQVDKVVQTVVGSLSQTVVSDLKAATADGKLSKEDAAQIKDRAVSKTIDLLSASVLEAAGKTVSNLQTYIGQKVEERVLALKK